MKKTEIIGRKRANFEKESNERKNTLRDYQEVISDDDSQIVSKVHKNSKKTFKRKCKRFTDKPQNTFLDEDVDIAAGLRNNNSRENGSKLAGNVSLDDNNDDQINISATIGERIQENVPNQFQEDNTHVQ